MIIIYLIYKKFNPLIPPFAGRKVKVLKRTKFLAEVWGVQEGKDEEIFNVLAYPK